MDNNNPNQFQQGGSNQPNMGQPNPYQGPNSYGQGQPNPYQGQPNAYNQSNAYNQPNAYNQSNAYGQSQPYQSQSQNYGSNNGGQNYGGTTYNSTNSTGPEEKNGQTLGIVSIICALLCPIAGIITGAIGLSKSKENVTNKTPKILNLIGLIASSVMVLASILIGVGIYKSIKAVSEATQQVDTSDLEESVDELLEELETTETITTEATTEATTEETTEATTEEASSGDTEPATTAPVDTGDLSTDLASMQIMIDGTVYTLPFDYSLISNDYTFDLADYGKEDGYVLNPGDKVLCTVNLENPNIDSEFDFSVGFKNYGDEVKDIKETSVWAMDLDKRWCDTDNYPSVVLPGGITWGSTVDDIKALYGEPADEPYRSDDLGYWEYTYELNDDDYQVRLTIYDEYGLTEINIYDYSY